MAGGGGLVIPRHRHLDARPDAETAFVQEAEVVLGRHVSLHGGAVKPQRGGRVVHRYALAARIHVAEIGLGAGKTLRCDPMIPAERAGQVHGDPTPGAIEMPEVACRRRVAGLRERQPRRVGGRVIARVVGANASLEVGRRGRRNREHEPKGGEAADGAPDHRRRLGSRRRRARAPSGGTLRKNQPPTICQVPSGWRQAVP